jgi:hypothetical protein
VSDNSAKISFISQLQNFARTMTGNEKQNLPKQMQGHVSQILENDFLEFTFDANGPFTLPKIKIPQAFSKYHREPTQVGDKGYIVSNDYYLGGESGDAGGTATMYPRGNIATGTYHPVSAKDFPTRDLNNFLITGGPTGITAQSADTKTNINIDFAQGKNSIIHNAIQDMLHTAGMGGQGNISHIVHEAGNIFSTIQQTGSIIHTIQQNGNIIHSIQQVGNIVNTASQGNISNIASLINFGGIALAEDGTTRSAPTSVNIDGNVGCTGSISVPEGTLLPPYGPPALNNAPQTVTGAKGGNVALASLLQALVALGLIVDNTTA